MLTEQCYILVLYGHYLKEMLTEQCDMLVWYGYLVNVIDLNDTCNNYHSCFWTLCSDEDLIPSTKRMEDSL